MKLSIVIVTFRESEEVLRACFSSVKRARDISFETIVVDNGGSDTTKALVGEFGFDYVRNTENRGFAYAVNQGMRRARGEYVLLLNPDTEFGPDVLKKMTDHLDQDQEVGIASAIIRYPDGGIQDSIRRFPGVVDQLQMLFKIPHVFETSAFRRYMMRDADPLKTQDVDSIMGAFMFIRRSLIDAIGYFDERYFIWFEEVDYCKMAHDAGFAIRHYADVEITHHKGHTFSKIATLRKQKWIRTSLRKYLYKHRGLAVAGLFWALTPIFILLGYAVAMIKPK